MRIVHDIGQYRPSPAIDSYVARIVIVICGGCRGRRRHLSRCRGCEDVRLGLRPERDGWASGRWWVEEHRGSSLGLARRRE